MIRKLEASPEGGEPDGPGTSKARAGADQRRVEKDRRVKDLRADSFS
jgi:hypothetical protein